jgi:hypothetical protein
MTNSEQQVHLTPGVQHTQDPQNPISNETGEYVANSAETVDRKSGRLNGVDINIQDTNKAFEVERKLAKNDRPHSFNGRLVGEKEPVQEMRDERTPDEDGPTSIARRNAEMDEEEKAVTTRNVKALNSKLKKN